MVESKNSKMRRTHSGYGYEPVPSTSYSMEEENDRMTAELRSKIGTLKSLSIDISTEVKYQDRMLRDMDDDFERTDGSLRGSLARVFRLSKGNHNYYILYTFLFALTMFFVLWIILKFK
ncbi:uncharacterized protein LOC106640937 [Copidosoma floridanum]|uniref:uncharacterized protein LOC106640937 n=1 Tax=Copidosoma floridanum TaxID=29053 RepID=UPI0006C9C2D8|nr:uncharacterized protein LOC106640937 [Copidosoma floridanum]